MPFRRCIVLKLRYSVAFLTAPLLFSRLVQEVSFAGTLKLRGRDLIKQGHQRCPGSEIEILPQPTFMLLQHYSVDIDYIVLTLFSYIQSTLCEIGIVSVRRYYKQKNTGACRRG